MGFSLLLLLLLAHYSRTLESDFSLQSQSLAAFIDALSPINSATLKDNDRPDSLQYSPFMAPTVVRDGQFRLFFFSREETRIHVHVSHPDGEAKFWLTPQVGLANHTGLSAKQCNDAQMFVEAPIEEIRNAWLHHFGS